MHQNYIYDKMYFRSREEGYQVKQYPVRTETLLLLRLRIKLSMPSKQTLN